MRSRIRNLLIAACLSVSSPVLAWTSDTDLYYSTGGTDGSSCGSNGSPCRTIQYTVDLATAQPFNGHRISVRPIVTGVLQTFNECISIGSIIDSGKLDLRGDSNDEKLVKIYCASANTIQTRGSFMGEGVYVRYLWLAGGGRCLSHGAVGKMSFGYITFGDCNVGMGPEFSLANGESAGPVTFIGTNYQSLIDVDAGFWMPLQKVYIDSGATTNVRELILGRHGGFIRVNDCTTIEVKAGTTLNVTGYNVRMTQNSGAEFDGMSNPACLPGGKGVYVGAGASYDNLGMGTYP